MACKVTTANITPGAWYHSLSKIEKMEKITHHVRLQQGLEPPGTFGKIWRSFVTFAMGDFQGNSPHRLGKSGTRPDDLTTSIALTWTLLFWPTCNCTVL